MDFSFMGGSMGSVVGEKFSRACDSAAQRGVPLVSITASGGARMQEGILSLMQLPKTVCAVEDLHDAGQAMISVMTHPTTAGVLASFASLGDVIVAEPGALLAFTGPRVVQQTTREKLPDDFGLAEQNLRFGHIDAIVPRPELKPYARAPAAAFLAQWRLTTSCGCAIGSRGCAAEPARRYALSGELEKLQRQLDRIQAAPTDEEIWRSVELARHQDRPYTLDYVERLLDDWVELHGDRGRADDAALVDRPRPVRRPHGCADRPPEGPRHQGAHAPQLRHGLSGGVPEGDARDGARRPPRLPADHPRRHSGRLPGRRRRAARPGRCDRPLPGADGAPGVPTVACVIGEGGSGGAIATALADRVLMQENAIYSVISPEGCAAILWRDAGEAKKAAAAFKPDAVHCLELGVIDGIVPEPAGGAQENPDEAARLLGEALAGGAGGARIDRPRDELKRRRRAKFRSLGVFA